MYGSACHVLAPKSSVVIDHKLSLWPHFAPGGWSNWASSSNLKKSRASIRAHVGNYVNTGRAL